jgi:hypothetical protein
MMDKLTKKQRELFEALAAAEHERWSDWQRILHNRCEVREDGCLVIPAELAAHWEQQIGTPYEDLSEEDKDKDREQVWRYWPLIEEYIK